MAVTSENRRMFSDRVSRDSPRKHEDWHQFARTLYRTSNSTMLNGLAYQNHLPPQQ